MGKILTKLIALTIAATALFTLTSCKKDEKNEFDKNTQNKTEDSKPLVHECVLDSFVTTKYPSFGQDGKRVAICECGEIHEESISWKNSILLDLNILDESAKSDDEVKKIVQDYRKAQFASAEEMFQYDLNQGYLDCVMNDSYAIYLNRYTGVMYYRNELTDEMLTSNPHNFNNMDIMTSDGWASQVSVDYSAIPDFAAIRNTLHSSRWASERNQIKVSKIENGLRVSYAIGITTNRCLLPVWIEAHEFEKDILRPLLDYFYQKMCEYLGEEYALDYFNGQRKIGNRANGTVTVSDEYYYNEQDVYADRWLHDTSLRVFFGDVEKILDTYKRYITINQFDTIDNAIRIKELKKIITEIEVLFNSYHSYNPSHPKFKPNENTPQKVLEGYAMYTVKYPTYDMMANRAETIKKYCPNYTFEKMFEDEAFCGYEFDCKSSPAFKIDIEYVLNDDGSFSVNLLSDSIVYNDIYFVLREVKLMHDYGNGNIESGEHIFLPSDIENES